MIRSPLAHPDWAYVEASSSEELRAPDWELLDRQRADFYAERQADHVVALLRQSELSPTFGYQVNNFRHCLQSATRVLRDGLSDEDVVVALLHDIGFEAVPERHGAFAAELLAPVASERNLWMLRHHQVFQNYHCFEYPADRHARDRWGGHEHFAWTAEFVERYDQNAIDPRYPEEPLETFIPIVRTLYAEARRRRAVDAP